MNRSADVIAQKYARIVLAVENEFDANSMANNSNSRGITVLHMHGG